MDQVNGFKDRDELIRAYMKAVPQLKRGQPESIKRVMDVPGSANYILCFSIPAMQGGKDDVVMRMDTNYIDQPRVAAGVIALHGVIVRFIEGNIAELL